MIDCGTKVESTKVESRNLKCRYKRTKFAYKRTKFAKVVVIYKLTLGDAVIGKFDCTQKIGILPGLIGKCDVISKLTLYTMLSQTNSTVL